MNWTSAQENLTVHAHATQSEHSNTDFEYVNMLNAPWEEEVRIMSNPLPLAIHMTGSNMPWPLASSWVGKLP